MRGLSLLSALMLCAGLLIPSPALARDGRIGFGGHYWKTLDKVTDESFDEDGVAWLISLQFPMAQFTFLELDVELLPDGFGGSEDRAWAPQAYLTLGAGIYAALGIGINNIDDEFEDDPFYAIRIGLDWQVLPAIYLDINANYRFEDFDKIKTLDEDVDTDVITLGAVLRLEL